MNETYKKGTKWASMKIVTNVFIKCLTRGKLNSDAHRFYLSRQQDILRFKVKSGTCTVQYSKCNIRFEIYSHVSFSYHDFFMEEIVPHKCYVDTTQCGVY